MHTHAFCPFLAVQDVNQLASTVCDLTWINTVYLFCGYFLFVDGLEEHPEYKSINECHWINWFFVCQSLYFPLCVCAPKSYMQSFEALIQTVSVLLPAAQRPARACACACRLVFDTVLLCVFNSCSSCVKIFQGEQNSKVVLLDLFGY